MRISDWSSDVCSSDLFVPPAEDSTGWSGTVLSASAAVEFVPVSRSAVSGSAAWLVSGGATRRDRKSVVEGKGVSVRVDLGGSRIIKKKQNRDNNFCLPTCTTSHNLHLYYATSE